MARHDHSRLPGSHRDRVFVGGSYAHDNRRLLRLLSTTVAEVGFMPIVADEYPLERPERDVHDVTLWLLHACRLAVFEVSSLSGATMEIERLRDYGVRKALLLYHEPGGLRWPEHPDAWRTTEMLKSLVLEQDGLLTARPYTRPSGAARETKLFLRAIRRSAYGKIHGFQ